MRHFILWLIVSLVLSFQLVAQNNSAAPNPSTSNSSANGETTTRPTDEETTEDTELGGGNGRARLLAILGGNEELNRAYTAVAESNDDGMEDDDNDEIAYSSGIFLQLQDDEDLDQGDVAIGLAFSYFQEGKTELAVATLKQLIEDRPDYAEAYFELGWIYMMDSKYPEAIEQFEKALAFEDLGEATRADAHYEIGWIHSIEDRYDEAMTAFKSALNVEGIEDDTKAEVYYEMAYIDADRSEVENALNNLEKAFKVGYSNLENITDDSTFEEVVATAKFQELVEEYELEVQEEDDEK
ncbi:MAG: tetratricopeptide repeat protein [Bacteroidota bacterium]